jgi:hypothetical protein
MKMIKKILLISFILCLGIAFGQINTTKNEMENIVMGRAGTIELIQETNGSYILDFKNIGNINFGKNKDLAEDIFESVMKLKAINRTDQRIFEMIEENIRVFEIWLDLK